MTIFIEEPPAEVPPSVAAYLRRMFVRLDSALKGDVVIKQWTKLPPKPAKYTIVAFKEAIPNSTVDGPGIFYFNGTDWVRFV